MSNMTYSLAYHFVPDAPGRKSMRTVFEDVAKMYQVSIIMQQNGDVTLAGAMAKEVTPILTATGLTPYMQWPSDIVTCHIETALPLYAVGMEDGWEIFLGDHIFIGFVSLPDEAVEILERASEYYTREQKFESLPQFLERVGLNEFRRRVLGAEMPQADSPWRTETAGGEFFDVGAGALPEEYERPPAATLHYGDFVRPENNLMDIMTVYPEMGPLLMEYGMHCIGCFVSYDESLWEACQVHGLDIFELMGEMNEYLADKLGKVLVTGETKLQDLFTLYPQTVAVLQEYGAALPDDMTQTLGELTAAQNISLTDLVEQIHRKLRKE